MFKKITLLLVLGFIFQFIISCCNPGPAAVYTMKPEIAEVDVFEIRNDTLVTFDSIVSRANFRLLTYIEMEQIRDSAKITFNGGGFSTLSACNNNEPTFKYINLVEKLEIFTQDTIGANRTNITDSFGAIYDNGYFNTVETELRQENEKLEDYYYGNYAFNLGFVRSYANIPSGNIYEIQFTLESGKVLTATTDPVYFTD